MEIAKYMKRDNPAIIAFAAAFCAGIMTHMFALTNMLQNYDNITASYQGFGNGVDSGRWLLTYISMVMHKFFGGYNLPWFNGIVAIFLLSVCSAFLADTFQFVNKWTSALLGILFVVFPTVSSILFFRFVSMYDALAILFSVLAAWVLTRYKWGAFDVCKLLRTIYGDISGLFSDYGNNSCVIAYQATFARSKV